MSTNKNTKIYIRKSLARAKQELRLPGCDRVDIINRISNYQNQLKKIADVEMGILPGTDLVVIDTVESPKYLPNLGKLRNILEKELEEERGKFIFDGDKSDNDIKRLVLKEAVLDYYNDLPYDFETIVVDCEDDMTLRRDDKDVDGSDYDFAPNKSDIYKRWIEKLERHIRNGHLSPAEFDEAIDRGIPQGGAFEKQLDRYRQDFVKRMWEDYYLKKEDYERQS